MESVLWSEIRFRYLLHKKQATGFVRKVSLLLQNIS